MHVQQRLILTGYKFKEGSYRLNTACIIRAYNLFPNREQTAAFSNWRSPEFMGADLNKKILPLINLPLYKNIIIPL